MVFEDFCLPCWLIRLIHTGNLTRFYFPIFKQGLEYFPCSVSIEGISLAVEVTETTPHGLRMDQ